MGDSPDARTAGADSGESVDHSDAAIIRRIWARYYGHIEDLIPDSARRAQFALDLGFLVGFASRFIELYEPPPPDNAVREDEQ